MDIYDDLLDEQPAPATPAAPTATAQPDVYDSLLDEVQTGQRKALQNSIDQALKVAPERAATTQSLAKTTGLPEEVVDRNFDVVQKQAKLREMQSLLASSPILARQMADSNFAKLAQDDLQSLSLMERIPRQLAGGAVEAVGRTVGGIGELLDIAQRNTLDAFASVFLPEPIGEISKESLYGPILGEDWQTAGGLIKQEGRSIQIPALQQTFLDQVNAGIGQVGAQVLATLLTGGTASTASLYAQGADAMAEKIEGDNASQGAKDLAVLGGAALTGVTEKWALDRILGPMAVPIQNQLGAALTRIGIAGVSEGGQEALESLGQDALRQFLTNPDAPIQLGQAFEEAGVGATVGAVVRTVVEAAVGVRARHVGLEQKAAQAEQNASTVEQLNQLAAADQLLQRSPESFEQFVAAAAEDGPVQAVYIDAQTLMQSGVGEQLARVSPAVAEQLAVAAATGGTVQIPIGEYAAKIAPTEFAQGLIDHLKTDPQGFSRAEARDYMQNQQQQLEEEIAQQLTAKAGDVVFAESQQKVKDLVLGELNALGRFTPQKNEFDATLIAARSSVRAAQLGMTPEAFFEQQRLNFTAQRIDGDTFSQDGELQTDTEAFRNWFGDSKVADEDGKPRVAYRYAKSEDEIAGGVRFFSRDADYAEAYFEEAGKGQGVTAPVYLRMENPLEVVLPGTQFSNPRFEAPYIQQAQTEGYDGVVFKADDDSLEFYVPFEAVQVKSAVGNRGTFDPNDPNILNQFAGVKSQTADLGQLETAKALAERGMSAAQIQKQTGWTKGVDGQWRYEISDDQASFIKSDSVANPAVFGYVNSNAKVSQTADGKFDSSVSFGGDLYVATGDSREKALSELANTIAKQNGLHGFDIDKVQDGQEISLANLIDHSALFAAYPDLVTITVKFVKGSDYNGMWDERRNTIELNVDRGKDEKLSTLLHEVQHAIQSKENFARGGISEQSFTRSVKDAVSSLQTGKTNEAEDWKNSNFEKLIAANSAAEVASNALKYQSAQRLIDYSKRDKPSGVFRLIRNEMQWIYGEKFYGNRQANDLQRMFYDLPKRGDKRNSFLSRMAWEGAQFLLDSIPADQRQSFKDDPRTLQSLIKALDRQASRARKELAPLRELESESRSAKVLDEKTRYKAPYDIYRALAGEIEARTTQARQQLTAEERRNRPIRMDMDIDPSEAIVIMGGRELRVPSVMRSQAAPTPRGSYNPNTNTIAMLKNADLSTFLHEAGHYFFESDINLAAQLATRTDLTAGEQDIVNDVSKLLDWHGLKGDINEQLAQWYSLPFEEKRAYHERTAESFEAYLFEGKAPSIELQPYFQQFRAWLLNVYKSLKDFISRNPEAGQLNDEVRAVFDRMLATTEQIQLAEQGRSMLPLFRTQAEADNVGMTPEEFAAYQAQDPQATNDAIKDLEAKGLRDLQWARNARNKEIKKLQRKSDELRREVRIEVRGQVLAEPVYRAYQFLTAKMDTDPNAVPGDTDDTVLGAGRLSLPELEGRGFTKEQINLLKARRMTAKDGLHPDLVAELPGVEMTSGDELVRKLLDANPLAEEIEARTDATMLERYGELSTPQAIEREADKAIHNEARSRMVATEANALARATGQRKILTSAAKQFAQTMIARIRVRDIKPSVYANAEARAAKAAEKASRSGDIVLAAAEKRTQLVNTYATRAAYDAQEEVDIGLRYLKKFERDGSRKGLDAEYLEQIDTLLERFDLRKGQSLRAIDKRTNLSQWVANQELAGLEPDIPDYILAEANRTSYKNLTVEEFRGMLDTVKQIEHLGRLKKKLLTAKDQRELDAIVDDITQRIRESSGGRVVDNERRDTVLSKLEFFGRWINSAHRKAGSVVRELDGLTDGGPMWNYFLRSMNEAGDREATMRADAARRLHELAKPVLDGEQMGGKGRWFPSLNRSLNRGERLAMALNWGNGSNRQRLLGGKGWSAGQAQPVLDSLTSTEWAFVQNVWDFFESYRPEISAKERRVYGKEPNWIEPAPFEITAADGQRVQVRGGYYPVKYDPQQSGKAGEFAEAEDAKAMMRAAYTAATTRRSFTKGRAEEVQGRPLLLTFDGIWQGANEVIHDLSWHEWLIDANRLMKRLDSSIRNSFGAEYVDVLRKAVKDTARGDVPATNAVEKSLQHIRNGSTIVGMGWNITTALMQPLGYTNSIVRIGGKWMGRGMSEFFGTPKYMVEKAAEVQAKSPFMANRALTMNREINDVRNRLVSDRSELRERIESSFFIMIQKMQATVDYPTWLGAYAKAIDDPANDEARAIALADQAVIDAQGSGQIKDLAEVQRGHPVMKLFTNFYSYFNVLYNLTTEQTKKRVAAKEYAGLMGDYMLLMVVPAVMSAIIRNATKGEDDEDEYVKDIASELVGYPFGMFVGVRELAGAIQLAAGVGNPGFGYSGPAGLRFFSEMNKLGQQVGQGEIDMALFKAANNVGGLLFHYPAGQVNRLVDGSAALIDGETQNPLAPLVGAPPRN